MTTTLTLEPRLDFSAVTPLKSAILEHVGNDLEIDASPVTHMGTLCLQVLLSAANDWNKSGQKFSVISPSETCITQLGLHGFSIETINGGTS